jgi:glycosyltransferase involved in cell wall biosynthesis
MIIATYPMFSNKGNLNADSNYVFLQKLITGILKKRPDWYFLYLFPNNSEWTYLPDGFFNNPQIIRIPLFMPTAKKQMVIHFDTKFFYDTLMSFYAFDVFLNNVVEATNQIMSMQQTFTKDAMFRLINQHHYVIHSDLPYASTDLGDRGLTLSQLSGTVLAGRNVFNSLNCKRMIDEDFTKYWGSIPEYKYELIPFGFDFDYYQKFAQPKSKDITFVYNHRLQDYKQWRDTFEIFDLLWQKGYKFKVLLTSISNKVNELNKKPYVERAGNLYNHEDYLKFISQGHFNVTNSKHETFCISAVESMIYGQVLIAPNKATFPELVYKDYKYLFNSKRDELDIIEKFLVNPDLTYDVGRRLQEHIKVNLNVDTFVDKWISLFENDPTYNVEDTIKGLKRRVDLEKYLSDLKGKIPLKLMHLRLRDWIGQRQAFTNMKLKRILNYYGFKDYFEGGVQYYLK